ncbi:MAG: autotransporter outer membrane beta-barrel domain-containing protein [Saezia sp.]
MNKIYKTKWVVSLGQCVVTSERASSQGKNSSTKLMVSSVLALFLSLGSVAYGAPVSKTDADAVGGTIYVTDAEISQVGSVNTGVGIGGVNVVSSANSNIDISGTANITNGGGLATHGILALVNVGSTGNVTIGSASSPLRGSITTTNTALNSSSHGILVEHRGQGTIRIYSAADIKTDGGRSRGIFVNNVSTVNTGDIIIESASNIDLNGAQNNFAAIEVENFGTGNVYISSSGNYDGGSLSNNSNGVYVHSRDSAVNSNINIGYTESGAIVPITGIHNIYQDGWGIVARHDGTGDINIQAGEYTLKNGIGTPSADSGIFGWYNPSAGVADKTSNILVNVGNATIETTGAGGSAGIEVRHDGDFGDITVNSKASVVTHGTDTHGIWARYGSSSIQNGEVRVASTGSVTTHGDGSKGIYALVGAVGAIASMEINVSGQIATRGNGASHAVLAEHNGVGNVSVVADRAYLTTSGTGVNSHGVEAKADNGNSTIVFHNGSVKLGNSLSAGLAAYQSSTGTLNTATAKVVVYNSVIDTSQSSGQHGVSAFAQGGGQIYIDANTQVHGGWRNGASIASAVGIGGGSQNFENYGSIDAMSDWAIRGSRAYGGVGDTLTINNYGTITGYISAGAEDATFNNYSSNSWNIRNFADIDGDGVRDEKFVAISDFGAGNDMVVNSATGAIKLLGVTTESSVNTADEYLAVGALSTSQKGIVQGQLLNLEAFDNAGLIDLTDNGLAGDVLVITGAAAATGVSGGGKYISNGGTIKLDTVMNQGGTASVSDMVVLDDVILGSGASKLLITAQTGSTGGLTTGDGIKVLEVLGTQDAGSFTLGAPVIYGLYEYQLFQGGTGGASDWYLRNTVKGVALTNPNVGGYLANQYAAGKMFYQNISDRQNSIYNTDRTIWGRMNYSQTKSDMLDGSQEATVRTTLIQLGADLYQKDQLHAGVYAGYGKADIESKSKQTGSKVDGDITGYHMGVYGSWIPEEARSPYVDLWGYYAWFDNELSGAAQQYKKVAYDSTGYALSVEFGYKLPLASRLMDRSWTLKPHAQLTYANIDTDDFYDVNNTYYSGNKASGVQTRIGARLSGEVQEGRIGVSPYVELNWLHNAKDNVIKVNGFKQDGDVGKNVAEIKLGFHGKPTERLSIWGHVGAQGGSDAYKGYEMQLGLDWRW